MLLTAVRAVFGLLAIILLLGSFGVNLGAILASVSLVSIALGFGAQYLVRDYLSGILIPTEDQYRVGDSVEINKIQGIVEDMRLRLTVLRDRDGTVHHIPNGEIRVASNRSKEFTKINQMVSVGYGSNMEDVFTIINRIGLEIAHDPEWAGFAGTDSRDEGAGAAREGHRGSGEWRNGRRQGRSGGRRVPPPALAGVRPPGNL
ncbi:MAG: mechanosensitive ion channel [Thermomicrobiales bacterium]